MYDPEAEWPLEKLPIGIKAFETMRGRGYLYVDKTRWVHRMVTQGMFYFLARPRRFGKNAWMPMGSFCRGWSVKGSYMAAAPSR